MSKEILAQVKETIKQLTPSEKATLVDYLLNQQTKEESNQEKQGERIFGLYPGGWISDDFNEPLADEFWLGENQSL